MIFHISQQGFYHIRQSFTSRGFQEQFLPSSVLTVSESYHKPRFRASRFRPLSPLSPGPLLTPRLARSARGAQPALPVVLSPLCPWCSAGPQRKDRFLHENARNARSENIIGESQNLKVLKISHYMSILQNPAVIKLNIHFNKTVTFIVI